MPSPTLPPELIGSIVQYLGDEWYDRKTAPSLAACCLASKAFLPFARAELYRSKTLSTKNDDKEMLLLRTLNCAPRAAALVRELTFHLLRGTSDTLAAAELVAQAVAVCSDVKSITISPYSDPATAEDSAVQQAVVGAAETLETLELLGGFHWEVSDLAAIVTKFHRLKSLRAGFITSYSEQTLDVSAVCQLESFGTHDVVDPPLLQMVLAASERTLKNLEFAGFYVDASFDFKRFDSLLQVKLQRPRMSRFDLNQEDVAAVFTSLGTCPSLEVLELLSAYGLSCMNHHPHEALPLLRLLPPSLTSFRDEGWLSLDLNTLLQLLSDHRLLPNLKSLRVPDHPRIAEEEWLQLTEEDISTIERVGGSRGISLCWLNDREYLEEYMDYLYRDREEEGVSE